MKCFILLLTLCYTTYTSAQIDITRLQKPDTTNPIERIIYAENKRLDSLMIKTDIWVSDHIDNQYDTTLGIIINKAKLLQALSKDNDANRPFLIRLIIAHEKMHAKHLLLFNFFNYTANVHEEQLLLDEVQADMAAGYVAFQFNDRQDAKYMLNILTEYDKHPKKPRFRIKDLVFGEKLSKDEQAALDLFFTLGDNQIHTSKYPNAYQRQQAFQLGARAAYVKSLYAEIKLQENKLSAPTWELLNRVVKELGNQIDYEDINTKWYDYFYNSWSYWKARSVVHLPTWNNKFIVYNLLRETYNDSTGYTKFQSSITNKNNFDSIKLTYAILLNGKPGGKTAVQQNNSIMGGTYSSIILGPNETKIVEDSLLDVSKVLDYYKCRFVFPGQLGSLYFTELENKKYENTKLYFYGKAVPGEVKAENYRVNESTIDDLLNNLHDIHKNLCRSDINDYKTGVGYEVEYLASIRYTTFIINRPFQLVMNLFPEKYYLMTTVFQDKNIKTVVKYLKYIKDKLEAMNRYKVVFHSEKNNPTFLELQNSEDKTVCNFSLKYDRMYKEWQVRLFIYKTM